MKLTYLKDKITKTSVGSVSIVGSSALPGHKIRGLPEAKTTIPIINVAIQRKRSIFPILELLFQMNAEAQYMGRIMIAYLWMLFVCEYTPTNTIIIAATRVKAQYLRSTRLFKPNMKSLVEILSFRR
jgi:hypothetical protein